MWLRRLGTCNNNKAAVGDSQHVELLTRVSWLSLRQIVASMGPGTTYGTKLILSQPLKTKVTNRVLQQTKTRINVRRYCDLEIAYACTEAWKNIRMCWDMEIHTHALRHGNWTHTHVLRHGNTYACTETWKDKYAGTETWKMMHTQALRPGTKGQPLDRFSSCCALVHGNADQHKLSIIVLANEKLWFFTKPCMRHLCACMQIDSCR